MDKLAILVLLNLCLGIGVFVYFKLRLDWVKDKLTKEIRESVVPKFFQVSPEGKAIIDLGIDIWRLKTKLAEIDSSLPENSKKSISNSILKINRYLQAYDIELQDHTGVQFNDGMNLEIQEIVKSDKYEKPIIVQTIEPSIFIKGILHKKGIVKVGKKLEEIHNG